VEVLIGVLLIAFILWGFYQKNFGWWKKHRRYPNEQPRPPSLDAFIGGGRQAQSAGASLQTSTGAPAAMAADKGWSCASCGTLNEGRADCWSCRTSRPAVPE